METDKFAETGFHDLKDDELFIIFDFLNYQNKLKLKLVCRKWKKIIDLSHKKNLSIFEYSKPLDVVLQFTGEKIDVNESVFVSALNLCLSENFISFFKNIQKLVIYPNSYNKSFSTMNLEHFQNLTHLEIHDVLPYIVLQFRCDSLKSLYVKDVEIDFYLLPFYFPNLINLKANWNYTEKLSRTLKLECLITENYLQKSEIEVLTKFCPNLVTLNCKLTLFSLFYVVVHSLKKLKKFYFYSSDHNDLDTTNLNQFKNHILQKNFNIKVYYCGICLNSRTVNILPSFVKVNRYHDWSKLNSTHSLRLMHNFYDHFDDLQENFDMITQIRYSCLENLEINLLKRLINVKKLNLYKCDDQTFNFLTKLFQNIKSISLFSSKLSQTILEDVVNNCNKLMEFELEHHNLQSIDFISQLVGLRSLCLFTKKSFHEDNIIKIIDSCKYLIRFSIDQKLTDKIEKKIFSIQSAYPSIIFSFLFNENWLV